MVVLAKNTMSVAGISLVGREFVIKPPLESGRARGNAVANGNISGPRLWFWIHL